MSNQFYNRNSRPQEFEKDKSFSEFATEITKENSPFEINPNGVFYQIALDEIDVVNFVSRSDLPSWFCGFIDLDAGGKYLSSEQATINKFIDLNTSISAPFERGVSQPVRFDSDFCLSYGVPGSFAYSQCAKDITARNIRLSQINWASNVNQIDRIIEGAIQGLEAAVYDEVNEVLLLAALDATAGEKGITARGDHCEYCILNAQGSDVSQDGDPTLSWYTEDPNTLTAVVLLPYYMSGETTVKIQDKNQQTLETLGRSGFAGSRPRFNLSKAGIEYGINVIVIAHDVNMSWKVGNPGRDHSWTADPGFYDSFR